MVSSKKIYSDYRVFIKYSENALLKNEVEHIPGKPRYPQTLGKIERYHRAMKNRILLEHYYSPDELERALGEFIDFTTITVCMSS